MPVPSFLSSFADKAQSAINATPLAGHLPNVGQGRPSSPDPAQNPANPGAAQGSSKSHALETLTYQFRNLQQQYSYVVGITTLSVVSDIPLEAIPAPCRESSPLRRVWQSILTVSRVMLKPR